MEINIIKGTNQIGGCITEIISKNARIIIDFGEDLPNENKKKISENPMIEGLTIDKAKYDAVFITHSHGDHIGLINYILDDIPVYVEKESQKIYELLCAFTYKEFKRDIINIEFEKTIKIKDINVTYYIVDHSSYNSAMILIESDGKRILHTGDYRKHGRKGKLFNSILEKIGKVDLLITEGTTFGREKVVYETEEELENRAIKELKDYNQVFFLQASTNIDRIVSFYKACKKTNKAFIEDLFTASITTSLNSSIPNPKAFKDVYVWTPLHYMKKNQEFKRKYVDSYKKYCSSSIIFKDFGMMVKTSMFEDIKLLKEKGVITNACLVYSMWEGYQKEDSFKTFIENVKSLGIDFKIIHTSGHADIKTIKELIDIIKPNKIVPIHTVNKEQLKEIFENVIILEDNEKIEI